MKGELSHKLDKASVFPQFTHNGSTLPKTKNFFHVHLISDATGETLHAVARAAAAQYANVRAIEHTYPLIRSRDQLDKAIGNIEASPGIVLCTLVDVELAEHLKTKCQEFGLPCVSILDPVLTVYRSYLGTEQTPKIGGQYILNAEYFRRIDALNYTIIHDDGQHPEGLDNADIILLGISRTSKTPTSMYLANRGIKTANVPLVPNVPVPVELGQTTKPLIVALISSPERIMQVRRNRLLSLKVENDTDYVDRRAIAAEITETKKLCARNNWPVIDVTRRSIEETAAGILSLYNERKAADEI